ncbi:MAG: flagellar hook protein, partial [Syntrophales bacterium]|nr:flagellar hook protein [Syntrophales bacterium]
FKGYLQTNFSDVRRLFVAEGIPSTGTIAYISHSLKTRPGEYAVNISRAATRSTSSPSDVTTLTGSEILTITEGGHTARVSLSAAMSMAEVAAAINSEMATVYNQVLAGSEALYSDAGHTTPITAATKWNSIFNATGQSAGIADGDVIAFTGTTRNGAAINGSYTISSAATDTVQGLLSAIETAFGGRVLAHIDTNGRIIVADDTEGTSNLSLSFDFSRAHNLNFGTLSTANVGGQAGRYAMPITAETNEDGYLVMRHNYYGSAYGFTIRQENNLLWTGGDQTVNNGLDVAGTINGEVATGNGQVLKASDEAENIRGLTLRYTGTETGNVGSLKLTLGIAELFDRALYYITDQFEGYVSYKQQSLKEQVSSFGKQIADMEARLEKRRQEMINRYVQMELALQKIQSQSNWLASQLNAATKLWKSS